MPIMVSGVLLNGRPPTAVEPFFYGWRDVPRTRPDGTVVRERVPLTEWDVLHPQEDDFIMQNDAHDSTVAYLKAVLRHRLAGRPGALVLSDHRVDWQAAGLIPHGPDIAVFLDAPAWDPHTATYPVRDQGARPVLVVEVTSPSTREKDLNDKVEDYHAAGVPLYVIADFRPPADDDTGIELRILAYQNSPAGPVRVRASEPNRARLPELDLWLAVERDRFVCLEADGSPVGDYTEVAVERDQAVARADEAEARADVAETRARADAARAAAAETRVAAEAAENQRLRDELAALRARLSPAPDTPNS